MARDVYFVKSIGVCGGIGETYDIAPTLIRLIVVFLCFATETDFSWRERSGV